MAFELRETSPSSEKKLPPGWQKKITSQNAIDKQAKSNKQISSLLGKLIDEGHERNLRREARMTQEDEASYIKNLMEEKPTKNDETINLPPLSAPKKRAGGRR